MKELRENGRILQEIVLVAVGNVSLLLAKMIIWFIVPKMLGVAEYGYYKTFTLYLTYASLLHLGFPDGILLGYGGKNYGEIDKEQMRSNSKFFLLFQMGTSCLLIICGVLLDDYIMCMIGIDIFFVNTATYYKFFSQAVMRFKELTIRNVIQALLQIIFVFGLFLASKTELIDVDGKLYIITIILIDATLFMWYLCTYSDITFGKKKPIRFRQTASYFSRGILLTFAYQISHFIFVMDSQMVSFLCDVNTYALYAFAYSITNLISSTVNAVSTVMFPSLKQLDEKNAVRKFSGLLSSVSILTFVVLIGYYPVMWIINIYLPEYKEAGMYLKVIMPGLAISSCINIIIFTYYKVLDQLKRFLGVSIVALCIGIATNVLGYCMYRNPISFSVASIITLLIWYLIVEEYFIKTYQIAWLKNYLYIIIEIVIFYICAFFVGDSLYSLLGYLLATIIMSYIFYEKKLLKMFYMWSEKDKGDHK